MPKDKNFLKISNVNDQARFLGAPELHSLVSVIHFDELEQCRYAVNYLEVYGMFLSDNEVNGFVYGTQKGDFHAHTLICGAPGQVCGIASPDDAVQQKGWGFLFDPKLLHGTELGRRMPNYTYFSYDTSEALVLSDEQRQTIVSLLEQIRKELLADEDKEHVNPIVMSYIGLLLEYVNRYYAQQLTTVTQESTNLLRQFENLLAMYFQQDMARQFGLPSVKYFAEQLCLSANYFGDLIRQQTGDTAFHIIQNYTMQRAYSLLSTGKTVGETSEMLGFEYPQHFSRAFKKHFGQLPSQVVVKAN